MPKQFQTVSGNPILYYALRAFENCAEIQDIVLVTATEWLTYVSQDIVDRFEFQKVHKLVSGGTQRQDSVFAGVKALDGGVDLVAIHDGVRPCISVEKIGETIRAAQKFGAAILAIRPRDSIKTGKQGFVAESLSRDRLWSVQTPQVFRYDLISQAHHQAASAGIYDTDDSALVERLGHRVRIVPGEEQNIKITVPLDLATTEAILATGD
ncbi:2-C-methyl-D-erythritol 4-phosphate cytidylyltransferase [bacterium]|nr:2-C-methyl-D-erythritol 4-phosphate cytidylyltransferase [bacterium]